MYNTVQCRTVYYTVQCTVQHSVQCSTVYNTVQCTVQGRTVYSAVQCTVQCRVQCNTVQYSVHCTIQCTVLLATPYTVVVGRGDRNENEEHIYLTPCTCLPDVCALLETFLNN